MATGFWRRHNQIEGTIGADAQIGYLQEENKRLYEKMMELEKKLLTKKLFEIKPRMSESFRVEGYIFDDSYADSIIVWDNNRNVLARCNGVEWYKVTEIKE